MTRATLESDPSPPSAPTRRENDLPVAVLAPTGSDATIAARVLGGAGLVVRICNRIADVCDLIATGEVAVLVVAKEALADDSREQLFEALSRQPSWSDLPIVLLTGDGELSSALPRALSGLTVKSNVTLLERPVRVATLTTVLQSAQRARQRQLDVRDYIEKRKAAELSLSESEQRLRSAVLAAPYPLMLHADDGEILQLSRAWTGLTGYDPARIGTTGDWAMLAYPEDDSAIEEFAHGSAPEGESVAMGERKVRVADGSMRIWDFHRVMLGHLPDGRRLNLAAANDVTAYRQLVESERAARRLAEEANSAKSQFLATMSHELRTPLNAIAGYTQLLSLGLRGAITPEQRMDLERIDRNQRHLLSLINDILNFAKIEAGHIAIESREVDVVEVLRGLQEIVEPQLREKRVDFEIRNEVDGTRARGDPDKVKQILINLLSNAIKFTPAEGRISVLCTASDEQVSISVTDDGAGIPADKLDAIFEPFVQVGRDFTSPHGGTGLGLAISRDLARRMKGELEVTSTLGEGSTFKLTLPAM